MTVFAEVWVPELLSGLIAAIVGAVGGGVFAFLLARQERKLHRIATAVDAYRRLIEARMDTSGRLSLALEKRKGVAEPARQVQAWKDAYRAQFIAPAVESHRKLQEMVMLVKASDSDNARVVAAASVGLNFGLIIGGLEKENDGSGTFSEVDQLKNARDEVTAFEVMAKGAEYLLGKLPKLP